MSLKTDLPYPSPSWLQRNIKPLYIACLIIFLPLWLIASWYVFTNQAHNNLQQQIKVDMTLFAESLASELEKYRIIPKMLIKDANLAAALNPSLAPPLFPIADHLLHIQSVTAADEVFLLDLQGNIKTSTEVDNMGLNYAFSPFFKATRRGLSGGFFTLGVNAGIRGYYFSEPIFDPNSNQVIGAVVIKVNMSRLERGWLNKRTPMMITDEYGIVIASSVPTWLFTSRQSLDDAAKQAIYDTRKYPSTYFPELQIDIISTHDDARIVSLPRADFARAIELNLALSPQSWQLYGHGDLQPLSMDIKRNTSLSVLLFLLTISLIYVAVQRRLQLKETMVRREINQKRLQQSKELLEIRVAERTQALQNSNDELKQTQSELIHAAKLATLGQMATTVTHEINQPLTAIQTSADNAEQWLHRGDHGNVAKNLSNIKKLALKMANITHHLKTFGRKADSKNTWVALSEAVNNAVELMALRCKQEHVTVSVKGMQGILVFADLVRLEQVFINLITNALDAMLISSDKQLVLDWEQHADSIVVHVKDTGCGIDAEHLQQLFDPFFTTKEISAGLGLGLSISYSIVEDMGGKLSARNRTSGASANTASTATKSATKSVTKTGAEFSIRLPARWLVLQADSH